MATIKAKFRSSTISNKEGRVYYQVIHERTTRQLLTDYRLYPDEWDEIRQDVKFGQNSQRMDYLLSIKERIRCDKNRWNRIIRSHEYHREHYSADSLIREFTQLAAGNTLFNFMEKHIACLKERGKIRTSETYLSALRSIRKYRNDDDILLESIDSNVMEGYQAWLERKGVAPNTISFYLRILRAVYNRAVDDDLTDNRRPFRRVYTGIEKTVKRALPLAIIRKIRKLDLTLKPKLAYARDMFMLSFMLRGMSFIDMAYLKKRDLNNGYVIYRRRKTHQQLIIAWTPEMQEILDRYPENSSEYLIPIIRKKVINERSVAKNIGENINIRLKTIAKMVGIAIPLTMYVARHSWASIAKSKGVPTSVISEGLGHEKESTTLIYLTQLDSTVVDRANRKILNLL